jgi:hypothetical protein
MINYNRIFGPFLKKTFNFKYLFVRQQIAYSQVQRSQSKILRMITNALWYATNQTLYDDLKVPFIKDINQV